VENLGGREVRMKKRVLNVWGVLYDLNDLLIFLTTVRYNNKNLDHDFIRVLSYGILQSCSFTFVMPIFL